MLHGLPLLEILSVYLDKLEKTDNQRRKGVTSLLQMYIAISYSIQMSILIGRK